jgi:biopolymer transport protein ExbB
LAPVWRRYDAAVGATDISVREQLERKAELLGVAFDRLEGLMGGDQFDAEVLGPRNVIERGRVVLAGPLGLFASDVGEGVGLVEQELNRADPSVLSPGNEFQAGIRKLMESGEGEIPLDASLGNAFKIQTTREGVWEHLMKGGVVIWPMMALALAAVLVAIVKWVEISRIRPASFSDLTQILRDLKESKREAALRHAKRLPGPSGALLVAAVEHAHEKKEYIEEVLYEQMLRTKPRIERWLPFLALTAAASPLLGLLGTVTGMISTFNMISLFGTGDPKTLSGGISEALITTECGLYIAIPALLVHAMLQRKAKGIMGGMEQMSVGFINGLPTRTLEDGDGVLVNK